MKDGEVEGACSVFGGGRAAHRVLVRKPEVRHNWDDTETDHIATVCEYVEWINLA